jgi:hypothetical protein
VSLRSPLRWCIRTVILFCGSSLRVIGDLNELRSLRSLRSSLVPLVGPQKKSMPQQVDLLLLELFAAGRVAGRRHPLTPVWEDAGTVHLPADLA